MVTLKDIKLTKLYYPIGEVAVMFNVNPSLLRFWEKEFNGIKPKKNKKGNRLYTIKDIKKLEEIYDLVKLKGYTLEGAKLNIKEKKSGIKTSLTTDVYLEVMEKLEKIKLQLLLINSEL